MEQRTAETQSGTRAMATSTQKEVGPRRGAVNAVRKWREDREAARRRTRRRLGQGSDERQAGTIGPAGRMSWTIGDTNAPAMSWRQ